ncbi:MAG: DUF402 domain-containing protein [Desulfurococcales archaeon]|nr:DUF402 domain-containing protein [Desulfurococcales archaeon]
MPLRVRVRGIYSTAISKILNDAGIELVDVSPQIAERLHIDPRHGLPADATVKSDDDDPSQMLILGFPEAVDKITDILEDTIPSLITYRPRIGLYSCFKAEVLGRTNHTCLASTPVGKAVLVDERDCTPGKVIPVTVVKVPVKPGERLVVSSKVRVVGKYAIVGYGSGVSFSSFIRNKDRIAKLLEVSAELIRDGYSIRWRSNADEADLNDIVKELPDLTLKLKEVSALLEKVHPNEVIYVGEHMNIIELTYPSKRFLDAVRAEASPTTPYHHMLRTLKEKGEGVVDLLDIVASDVSSDKMEVWVRKWIHQRLSSRKDVVVHHRRVLKKNVLLGRMQPKEVKSEDGIHLTLKRTIKSAGVYDGLGIPKEVGDYSITRVTEGSWHITHEYFSSNGISKGLYININTPPEILPDGTLRYVDLEVDVVKIHGKGCRMIDSGGFREIIAGNAISGDIIENVIKEFSKILATYCSTAK